MGYTHYYQLHRELTSAEMKAFIRSAVKIRETAWEIALDGDYKDDYLILNGIGAESHEDFYLNRTNLSWNFCKTNQKPYDDVVTALLILARYLFPQAITVSSDGSWSNWRAGRELFTQAICLEPAESSVFGGQDFDHKRGSN